MKILFYNHTGQVSGAERVLLMILARLDRAKFSPVVVCPEDGSLSQMVAELGTPVELVRTLQARFTVRPDLLLGYLKSFFQTLLELRKKVKIVQPDVIHANSIRAGLVATTATAGMRTSVVWHLHDILPRHPISTAIRCLALVSRRTQMIAVSQAVADRFVGSCKPLQKRMNVLLNAVDLTKFRPSELTKHEARANLQLPDTEPLVGIVGQLTPRKGQLELIQAFAVVLKEIPSAHLLIVGSAIFNRDQEYAHRLVQTAEDLGIADQVMMLGELKDVPGIMHALDVLVVNSIVEPFGLVAIEALACGTPVVATASGGTAELIEHEKNGLLIPVGNNEALARAIIRLSASPDLRLMFAEQGKIDVTRRFSAERYMTELHAFYSKNEILQSTLAEDLPPAHQLRRLNLPKRAEQEQ